MRLPRVSQTPSAPPPSGIPTTGRASDMRRMSWAAPPPRYSLTGRPSLAPPGVLTTDVKKRNRDKVIKFLCECDNSHDAASINKLLTSKLGYKQCFETIIRQIYDDPAFSVVDNLETAIPEIMSQFAYPYLIKASYFQPIGVLHTFPHLMAVLAFLVDVYDTYDHITENPPSGINFNDSGDSTAQAYNYAFQLTVFKKCSKLRQEGSDVEEHLVKERDAFIAAYNEEEALSNEATILQMRSDELAEKAKILELEEKRIREIESETAARTASTEKIRQFMRIKDRGNVKKAEELECLKEEEAQLTQEVTALESELEAVKEGGIIAMQREHEHMCEEQKDRILVEADDVLREMTGIEDQKKELQKLEEDVIKYIRVVPNALRK